MNASQPSTMAPAEATSPAMRPGDGPSIAQRIRAARRGSNQALGELLEGCRQFLSIAAAQQLSPELRSKVGASDLVQETFMEAQRGFPQFRGRSRKELLAWLRRILLNNIRDLERHYKDVAKRRIGREVLFSAQGDSTLARGLPRATAESPSWWAQLHENSDALHRALGELAEDQRQVILLRNLELRSFDEIGSIMNRSPEAARKLWGRALIALGNQLGADDVSR